VAEGCNQRRAGPELRHDVNTKPRLEPRLQANCLAFQSDGERARGVVYDRCKQNFRRRPLFGPADPRSSAFGCPHCCDDRFHGTNSANLTGSCSWRAVHGQSCLRGTESQPEHMAGPATSSQRSDGSATHSIRNGPDQGSAGESRDPAWPVFPNAGLSDHESRRRARRKKNCAVVAADNSNARGRLERRRRFLGGHPGGQQFPVVGAVVLRLQCRSTVSAFCDRLVRRLGAAITARGWI